MNTKKARRKFFRICRVLEQNAVDDSQTKQWRELNQKCRDYLTCIDDLKFCQKMVETAVDYWRNKYRRNRDDFNAFNMFGILLCIKGVISNNDWLRHEEREFAKKEREYNASKTVSFTLQ